MIVSSTEAGLSSGTVKVPQLIVNNSPTSTQSSLFDLIEHAGILHSQKTAIICGTSTITHGELNVLANGYAGVLTQQGVRKGDLVAVALNRSIELVAVLLAILKTGAAYVPIDPAFPAERIIQMMDDACPELFITSANLLENYTLTASLQCLTLEEARQRIDPTSCSNGASARVTENDLAYVMYTSGSTGKPKGVEVSHGNVCNLLLSMQGKPGCSEKDRLLAITTIAFDMAVLELYLPLVCGATTVIAQEHEIKDMAALVSLMGHHEITIMQGTPAIWQMLLDAGWQGCPRLAKIFCGGEALSRALADRLLHCGDEIWNMYGPTEATVYASIWKVRPVDDIIIGNPIKNCYLYILDDQLSPVPFGQPGELCVGGAGVARGYRNNYELSRSRFVKNPFHDGLMYRTGDVARLVESGEVKAMGRADGQIKIRGYRIEPGDIEAAITARDEISGAVVICRDDRLLAYYVRKTLPRENGVVESTTTAPLEQMLRPWLAERLPAYMVPAFFVEMNAFPVTINGKIDRKALPDPITAIHIQPATVMPTTELESRILSIWSKVLGHSRVGLNDNFFDIGGDSLRIVRVQKELQNILGRPVSTAKLFEHYTVKALAAHLNALSKVDIPELPQIPTEDISRQDIAVVSMACRLPGDIVTPEGFWEFLESGGDAIADTPVGRWGCDTYDRSYCRRGGFISSVYSFDTSFFGISPREAARLDPSQYMMLETCWEAIERAGYTAQGLRDSSTGVFIGTSNILTHQGLNPSTVRDLADLDGYTVTGSAAGTMSGRISYHLGLQGPTMTIDTACSSSLVTTHLACNALRLGECDMAVSGGISLLTNPGLHVEFDHLQGMSPDGRCRSFSADAQGTGWSEGSVVVLLKRLSDAQRDGDTIHAVIRGSAVNHDGRSASLTTPSGHAQQRLVRTALATAQLQPHDIDYVEAHGTGTKLGDPIEATALAEVFGPSRAEPKPLYIGSVKSNIGHTQAAAGLVGLLKIVLAIKNSLLPRTLHVTEPTPAVDWQGANIAPNMSNRAWPLVEGQPRRAGVSAFGIGGTNAHIILQEPPPLNHVVDKEKLSRRDVGPLPILLSGDTDLALRAQVEKLGRHIYLQQHDDDLRDIAYSLATTRTHFRKRIVLAATEKSQLLKELDNMVSPGSLIMQDTDDNFHHTKMAMLFTGQGSQWPGMGKALSEVHPIFHQALLEIAKEFDKELEVPLLDVMWAPPGSDLAILLERTDYAQPALFALEVALWRLWEVLGVRPDFLFGHSLGEVVAAHVAGVFDMHDACRLVAARGRLMQSHSGDFSMAALEASAAETEAAIGQLGYADDVGVALYNTPFQTVISGTMNEVESIMGYFSRQGRKVRSVVIGHAFHSRQMDGVLAEFLATVETLRFHPPTLRIISSLNGKLIDAEQVTQAQYWIRQIREPVRFTEGIQTLAGHGVNTFLELGPGQVLCGLGAACLSNSTTSHPLTWLPSIGHGKNSASVFQASVSQLHTLGADVIWRAFFEPLGCRRILLPTYAFQRNYHVHHSLERQHSRSRGHHVSGAGRRNLIDLSPPPDRSRVQFGIAWQLIGPAKTLPRGTWGVVTSTSDETWAESVINSLSQTELKLHPVDAPDQAEKLSGLLCLWDADMNSICEVQDLIATALSQIQMAVDLQFSPPIIWITRHAVGTGVESDDHAMRLGVGPLLWGLMRTARTEHPELQLRLIDLGVDSSSASILSVLPLHEEPECALRQGRILVPRMRDVVSKLDPSPQKPRMLRTDGAVLITGGLGHLGARLARWLVNDCGINDLVLTSRRGMQTSGADALVNQLSKLGARVTVVVGDMSSFQSVKSIMAMFSSDRPLRGVVHAAGAVDSGVISALTPERCETTIRPKAYGAWFLHESTRNMDLDLFLMISSVSGIMGLPGLANYAAANTFLDALAHLRRAQGLPGTSVAFGTLAGDGGMASRLGHNTRSYLARFGLNPLSLDVGVDVIENALVSKRAMTVAAALDLPQLQRYLEQQNGGIPPLLALLLVQGDTVTKSPLPKRQSLRDILARAEAAQRPGIILNTVRQVLAKALGFTNPDDMETNRSLKDLGIDSLIAVQIRNQLTALTGLRLPVNIALMHPNLGALGQSLLSQLEKENGSAATPSTLSLNMAAIRQGCVDKSFKFGAGLRDRKTPQRPRPPKAVFLTGTTGFVGAFILNKLLKRGVTSHCLVRAESAEKGLQRLVSTLQTFSLWEAGFKELIKPVVGDITRPFLGMDRQAFEDLSNQVDSICHSGALVDWMRPLEDYVGPNIVSAHEILRLASCGRFKGVHLISTISTLPKHMGLDLNENDIEYGYGTSKYIAEKMMAAARWRGASTYVYRLPYVTASAATGHFRRDRGDFLHNFTTGCLEIGEFPMLEADLSYVLPVDYLAECIVATMTLEVVRKGQEFDFLNSQALSCTEYFRLLGTVSDGEPKPIVAFGAWRQRALAYASANPGSSLARIGGVLETFTEENANSLFEGLPVGEHVFGGEDYPAPKVDNRFVQQYLSCIRGS
ncbi:hypothetical protein S40288_05363 [Stachybotrys chartarum IBT 40288]|nr:hypothetical protein S40288_05363 [Stachybotrys chartarum IBT 40288]